MLPYEFYAIQMRYAPQILKSYIYVLDLVLLLALIGGACFYDR